MGGDETFISEGTEKWRVKYGEVQCSEVKWKEGSEMKWSEVIILGELFVLSFIYNYVALCRLCAVRFRIFSCTYLLFSN